MALGSGHQTVTTGANFIPEIWSKELQRARESNLVASNLFKRFDVDVKSKGDTIHVPLISNLSVNAKAASTQVTFNAPTENVVDININKHYECSFLIEDVLDAQSAYNLAMEYKDKQAYALAKQMDTDVLALYTNITQTVSSSGTPPTDSNILRAVQYLDDADAPAKDRVFIMRPSLKSTLLAIDRYVDTNFVGMGDMPVKTGLFGQRYGLAFYVSTNIPLDGSSNPVNIVAHKETYALAVQKDLVMRNDYIIEYLSNAYVGQVLYGVKTYRSDHACLVYSN